MARVIVLGTSNAIASEGHENTHMVIIGSERTVLIDCVSSPILRLNRAGVDFNNVTDLVVTHFHPDHVSGIPLLLMDMWLMGRKRPLSIYGLHHTLDRVEDLMGFFGWAEWPDFFPVAFYRLPLQEMTQVLDCPDFRILCSPVHHLVPTIGIRCEFKPSSKVMAYSCDTEPCAEVAQLAQGANILIHEAAGRMRGHSSAEQAGEMASRAEVEHLYLIHYPTGKYADADLVKDARRTYNGDISVAEDFMVLEMDK